MAAQYFHYPIKQTRNSRESPSLALLPNEKKKPIRRFSLPVIGHYAQTKITQPAPSLAVPISKSSARCTIYNAQSPMLLLLLPSRQQKKTGKATPARDHREKLLYNIGKAIAASAA